MPNPYDQANAVLDRAARRQLLWGGFLFLALSLLVGLGRWKAGAVGLTPSLMGAFGALLLLIAAVCWAGYRDLTAFRFSQAGIVDRRSGRSPGLPWDAIEEIHLGRGGFRIRMAGGRVFKANLTLAGETRALVELLQAQGLGRVRVLL